ncbi:DUF1385 domain-containing protein [Bacillus sonorensis]|uniref:DUF1385 domain-containing protein n=1 Tax=Bacillus subtilis group TaxID=653685 RepID=UPI001FD71D07|nr:MULTISPECIES: DUF1385 domain-containing protein [Bacillus subtilis group]MCJ8223740.1 DUF1385 domain-containing protein [Bacillus paralicheniformis]MEC0526197.1 DUF1385 domain-containing protein [Bacillus sonorensis]
MQVLGGMARKNSVTFKSKNYQVTAKLNKDGSLSFDKQKVSNSETKKSTIMNIIDRIPFIRGIITIFNGVFVNKRNSILFILLIISSFLLSLIDGGESTLKIPFWLINALTIIMFIIAFMFIKFTEIGKYHSAEHMVGNNYEQGNEMSLINVKKCSRIHRYCGTNLVILILIIYFCMMIFLDSHFSFSLNLMALFISTAVAYEIHISENEKLNIVLYPLYFVTGMIQYLTVTSKPDDKHLLVAIAAFKEVEKLEGE